MAEDKAKIPFEKYNVPKIAHHSNLAPIKNQGLQLRPSTQWLWQSHTYRVSGFEVWTQYGQSQSEKKWKSLDFYYHSNKVHTQEAQNVYQLKSSLSDLNLSNFQKLFLISKSYFTKIKNN